MQTKKEKSIDTLTTEVSSVLKKHFAGRITYHEIDMDRIKFQVGSGLFVEVKVADNRQMKLRKASSNTKLN